VVQSTSDQGRALLRHTDKSAREVAEESLRIASEICVYTNGEILVEEPSK